MHSSHHDTTSTQWTDKSTTDVASRHHNTAKAEHNMEKAEHNSIKAHLSINHQPFPTQ